MPIEGVPLAQALRAMVTPQRAELTGVLSLRWPEGPESFQLDIRDGVIVDVRGVTLLRAVGRGPRPMQGRLSQDLGIAIASGTAYPDAVDEAVESLVELVAQGIGAGLEADWAERAESPPGGFPLSASLYDLASKALPIARDPAEVAAEFLPSALRVVSRRTPPGRDALDAIAQRTLDLVQDGIRLEDLILRSGRGREERTRFAWRAFDLLYYLGHVRIQGERRPLAQPAAPVESRVVPPAPPLSEEEDFAMPADPDEADDAGVAADVPEEHPSWRTPVGSTEEHWSWRSPAGPTEEPAFAMPPDEEDEVSAFALGADDEEEDEEDEVSAFALGPADEELLPEEDDPTDPYGEAVTDQQDAIPVEQLLGPKAASEADVDEDELDELRRLFEQDFPQHEAPLAAQSSAQETLGDDNWVEVQPDAGDWNKAERSRARVPRTARERLTLFAERLPRANPLAALALPRDVLPTEDDIGDAYDHRILEFHEARWLEVGDGAAELAASCRRTLRAALRSLNGPEAIAAAHGHRLAEAPPFDPYDLD